MSIHNHHYRDIKFNQQQSTDCTLLVLVGTDSFSYAVTGQSRLLLLEENVNLNELTKTAGQHQLLFSTYKQRVVGLPHRGFSFVPVSLFRPDKVADFARFLDVKDNEKVISQLLDAENQVIYKVDERIIAAAEVFGIQNSVFAAKGWIMAIAASNPQKETLYLDIDQDKLEILNFRDGKLRFYNSFEFKTEDELVYFASFVAGELDLQTQNTTLILSGDAKQGDKNTRRLAEFFYKVEWNNLKPVDLPAEIPSQNVLSLTALSLCGSSEAL